MLGTLFTMTTYGTWLRGDRRGWVEDGTVMPPNPRLEDRDQTRMNHEPYLFDESQLLAIGDFIGKSFNERLAVPILALTVQTWHIHLVSAECKTTIPEIVKCTKDAVRYGLRAGRPIWTDGYDKRYCYDERTLQSRIEYVERHNIDRGWPARPWPFIVDY